MWLGKDRDRRLEGALRALRAEAPPELIESITGRMLAPRPGRRTWSRLAFSAAVTAFVLGSFASFGGLSYAAPGIAGTVAAAKQIVVAHTLKVRVHTPSAASQYPPPPSKPHPHKPFTPPKPKVSATPKTTPPVTSGKTLPFTGMSLLATLVVSLALVGLGLGLRRRERRN